MSNRACLFLVFCFVMSAIAPSIRAQPHRKNLMDAALAKTDSARAEQK